MLTCLLLAPTPPLNVFGEIISSSEINVTWKDPVKWNGVPANYEVEFKMNKTGATSQQIKNIPTTKQFHKFSSLDPYTKYQFRVRNGALFCCS